MVTNIWVAFSCYNRRTSPCVIHGALLVHSIHPCHTLASHDDDRLPAASKTKTKSKSLVHSTVPRPFRKGCPAGRTAPRPVSGSAASASGAGGRCRRCRRAPGPVSSLSKRNIQTSGPSGHVCVICPRLRVDQIVACPIEGSRDRPLTTSSSAPRSAADGSHGGNHADGSHGGNHD